MTAAIMHLKQLQIGYPGTHNKVLGAYLNVQLQAGQCIAIVGPNGAGKTTLLRTLAGLLEPLQGSVYVQDMPLKTMSLPQKAQHISVVLTHRMQHQRMRVYDLVALGRFPHTEWHGQLSAEDKATIGHALEATCTDNIANRWLDELSDGQCQRVMMARALAQNTPIMLLDEPTTHLDLQHSWHIFKLMHQWAKHQNKLVIYSTHHIEWALLHSDLLWVAQGGTWHLGTPEQCIEQGLLHQMAKEAGMRFDAATRRFMPL